MATLTGFNHIIAQQYRTQAGTVADVIETINGDSEINIDELVPAGSVDYIITLAVPFLKIVSMALWSSAASSVRTNSSGGDDVFALVSTHPVLWNRNSASAKPITVDIASLYVDIAGALPVRVRASFLVTAH